MIEAKGNQTHIVVRKIAEKNKNMTFKNHHNSFTLNLLYRILTMMVPCRETYLLIGWSASIIRCHPRSSVPGMTLLRFSGVSITP